ncbi:MAG: vWA domain-containing protein, partial [Planctomycetota bacterium]
DLGRDPAAWKAWWSTREAIAPIDKALGAPKEEEPRRYAHENERDTVGPDDFGIPVRGRRVVFCADVSASMRYKLPLAYDQLARAVKGLPSTSRFEIVFFNEFVHPWRGRLSHADPVTKELVVRHLPTIEIKSYTNLFDALEAGLAMEPTEIFLISDGEPNRGRKQLPRDILSELRRSNSRKVPIHTVSVVRTVDGDGHIPLLREIAEESGGEHVERTLR